MGSPRQKGSTKWKRKEKKRWSEWKWSQHIIHCVYWEILQWLSYSVTSNYKMRRLVSVEFEEHRYDMRCTLTSTQTDLEHASRKSDHFSVFWLDHCGHVDIATACRIDDVHNLRLPLCGDLNKTDYSKNNQSCSHVMFYWKDIPDKFVHYSRYVSTHSLHIPPRCKKNNNKNKNKISKVYRVLKLETPSIAVHLKWLSSWMNGFGEGLYFSPHINIAYDENCPFLLYVVTHTIFN